MSDNQLIKDIINQFINRSIQKDSLKTNDILKNNSNYKWFKVKISFWMWTYAKITWISFLRDGNKTSKGIYPAVLFNIETKKIVVAYGISETNPPVLNWWIENKQKILEIWWNKYKASYIEDIFNYNQFSVNDIILSLDNVIDYYNWIPKNYENNTSFWIYSPWENASKWDEFHSNWIMWIGWDELWNFNDYSSKDEIRERLSEITGKDNPYNDVLACEDFVRNIKIWDIVIPKQWTKNYLWYWIVEWDYEFDDSLEEYKSKRNVKWVKKWIWEETEWSIVLKTLTNIDKYTDYIEKLRKLLWINLTENNINTPQMDTISKLLNTKKQIILYWPPGTGKTYNIKSLIENHSWEDYDTLKNNGRVEFITFHQSFSYEEFIEWIKPNLDGDSGEISYEIKAWVFKEIANKAKVKNISQDNFEKVYQKFIDDVDVNWWLVLESLIRAKEFTIYKNSNSNIKFHANTDKAYPWVVKKDVLEHYLRTWEAIDWPSYTKSIWKYLIDTYWYIQTSENDSSSIKNYYLIIDEINRWNISKIFGELITLLEADKRIWEANEVITKLPYSKEDFWIPSNLFIVATMNTSDKSIVSLDTALRRRFWFIEMLPDYTLEWLQREIEGINLSTLLQKINNRIEYLIDKDHLIGHSYFLKMKNIEDIKSVIYNEIVPLLEEYFYWEEEKMMQVLWSWLFEKKNTANDLFEKKAQIDIAWEQQQYVINKHLNEEEFLMALRNIIKPHEEA